MKEIIEFSAGEVREEIKTLYENRCQIEWCRKHTKPTKKDLKQMKTDTLEHIIPKKLGGSDHLKNLTYTVAFCNSKKGHEVKKHKKLIDHLLLHAERNWLIVLKNLLSKKIDLTGKNKGFYVVRILTVVYEVKITRKGNIYVVKERELTTEETTFLQARDFERYTSP